MGFLALTTHVAYLFSPFSLLLSFLNRSIFYFLMGLCVFSHVCAHVHGYETRGWWVSISLGCSALYWVSCWPPVLANSSPSPANQLAQETPPEPPTCWGDRQTTNICFYVGTRTWLLSSLAQISLNFTNQIFNVYHIRKCLNKLSLLMYF